MLFLRESLPHDVRLARAQAQGSHSVWHSLFTRSYLGYAAACGFGMAIMMAYISASPFVYQEMIGLSAAAYGLARSEEHTSELQSLMRISYAVFCLKKKIRISNINTHKHTQLQ